jgi:acyl-CoA hydrolase
VQRSPDQHKRVVTSRGLVRYVVTENGVAYLHGKSIRKRVEALIEIAHPKFRNELYKYCEKTKWLQRSTGVKDRQELLRNSGL